jgi:cytochrome c oxidase subunit 2
LLAGAAIVFVPLVRSRAAPPDGLHVVARKWFFDPATINAKRGEELILRIDAPEVPMGFNVPDFNVRTDVVPGQQAVLRFRPDKVGSFTFLCDIFCGNGHETMNGTLVVTA